ncbi:hypothetical protein [Pararhizobium sp. IMCC21322]|uniref:hypothetical protein n=1 Tax=Pararhizobium sp. IMCC21322 TaxID=3067903 RepID=UPI00274169B5|nr:hypothetical protein [Pararhizobium sp. IMCC21322]
MHQISSSGKAGSEARCGASGELANAAGGLFWFTEGLLCALAGHRYTPLMVVMTTAWRVPRRQTRKAGQMLPYKQEGL